MRVQLQNDTSAECFAIQLLDIENGKMPIDRSTQCITLPTNFCEITSTKDELIQKVFPNIAQNYQDPQWLRAHAILAATNNDVNAINFSIKNEIPGKATTYKSIDIVMNQDEVVNYPTEFLNSLNLPEFLHSSVRHIEISRTYLQSVDDETFQGLRLETLKLTENKISEFSEKSFNSMVHSLLSLDISGNLFQYLPLKSLRNIHSLSRLIAQRNQIQELDGNWGQLVDSLRSLHLSGNSINDISYSFDDKRTNFSSTSVQLNSNMKTFTKLRKLVWLDLSGNRIAHINPNILPKSLMTIDLSRNIITIIPPQLFEHLRDLKIILFKDNLIKNLNNFNDYIITPSSSSSNSLHHYSNNNNNNNNNNKILLHLEKLDLSLNEIENLTTNLFNQLIKVKALNFDKNFLREIPENVFLNSGIVHLVLAFNFIETIESNSFNGLEDSLEYLDLERNRLAHIPEGIGMLSKLRYLYFTSNLMNEILYQLPSTLRVLSLSGNNFNSIPSYGLINCTELSYLNMGYNKISEIQENEFLGWGSNLQTLLLRNNKITSLNYGVFNGLDSIKEISLSFNDIHYVYPNVFENVSKTLKILELSFGIYRDDFPLEALCHLTELLWLGLDNNNLKIISENSLSSLHQLTYINFGFNRIKILPKNIFLPEIHRNLFEIDLSFNLIERVVSNTFDDLPELQMIHLTSNQINTIEKHSFYNLPYLIYLDLTYNFIQNISENSFIFLPNLLKIDLMFNELKYFSLKFFKFSTNSSAPMSLNLSYNKIQKFNGEINSPIFIYKLDLSNNLIQETTHFQKISLSLKNLNLNNNNISILINHAFGDLEYLEQLDLMNNNIILLRRRCFQGLKNLQELNLSKNKIEQLQVEQFSNLKKLRILILNDNKLKTLSRDLFLNTRIEFLNLNNNFINVWPTTILSDIGFTLRNIQFGGNLLEYIDTTMFVNIQFLLELNLAKNKITLLPDTTFINLSNLTILDLSYNPLITSNFKELFLNSPRLKVLRLRSTGLYSVPLLSLEYLTELDISNNYINDIYSLSELKYLRKLNISHNKLVNITSFGRHMPSSLRDLDISKNPLRKTTTNDFSQLKRLETLNIENIRITSDIFTKIHNLRKLYITGQTNLGEFVSKIPGLRQLTVTIHEDKIDDNLFAKMINNTKLNLIEIIGQKLIKITTNAFYGLSRNHDLTIKLQNTLIDDVPPGIFFSLKDVPRLTIDLSNNLLSTLSPDSFYPNASSWDAVGTRSVVGGLDLANNPLQCDCGLVWLGHWLRRWLRETSQANMISKDEMRTMIRRARQSTCHDQQTGKEFTLLEIFPEDLLCHASALSSLGNIISCSFISVSLIFIFIYQHRIILLL